MAKQSVASMNNLYNYVDNHWRAYTNSVLYILFAKIFFQIKMLHNQYEFVNKWNEGIF